MHLKEYVSIAVLTLFLIGTSSKDQTTSDRNKEAIRVHALTYAKHLQTRRYTLSSIKNKKLLIKRICSSINRDESFKKGCTTYHRLLVTGSQKK